MSTLPIPRRARVVLVFGGSFDPPHRAHARVPLEVAERLYGPAGHVLYIPAARSPLKSSGPVAADQHRLRMLELALAEPGLPKVSRSIWTDELDRAARARSPGPSYTVDTLRRLKAGVRPGVTLRLLIGSDQAAAFHRWKSFRTIIRLAEPLVMPRGDLLTVESLYSALASHPGTWKRRELAAWCTRLAPSPVVADASTNIRAALAKAPPRAADWARRPPLDQVAPAVAAYIVERGLYGR